MKQSFLGVVGIGLVVANTAFADTIHLKNGNTLEGSIEASNEQQVTIDIPGAGQLTLERAEIASIEKSSPSQEATSQPTSQSDMNHAANMSQSSPAPSGISQEEKYSNPALGISIVKPASWSVRERGSRIALYRKPDDDRPTLEFATQPLGNLVEEASDPKKLVEGSLAIAKMTSRDFKMVQAPENVVLNGRKAGHAAYQYSRQIPGGRTVLRHDELWMIPGKHDVIIVAAGMWQDDPATTDEIRKIVNNLAIEH